MIGVPASIASASCWLFDRPPSPPMARTTPVWCSICAMASWSCLSSTVRSVTTMTLWKYGSPSGLRMRMSSCAVQEMVFVLPEPALCWIR